MALLAVSEPGDQSGDDELRKREGRSLDSCTGNHDTASKHYGSLAAQHVSRPYRGHTPKEAS